VVTKEGAERISYVFAVRAHGEHGWGALSDFSDQQQGYFFDPPEAPNGLRLLPPKGSGRIECANIEVEWLADTGCEILEYEASASAVRSGQVPTKWLSLPSLGFARRYSHFSDVPCGWSTHLAVRVRARNAAGWGAWSAHLTLQLGASEPPLAPSRLSADPMGCDALLLTWEPGDDRGSPVRQHEVSYRCGKELEREAQMPQQPALRIPGIASSPYQLTGLPPGAQCVIAVRAMNTFGWGPEGLSVTAATACMPPVDDVAGHGIDTQSLETAAETVDKGDAGMFSDDRKAWGQRATRTPSPLDWAISLCLLVAAAAILRAMCCTSSRQDERSRSIKPQRVHLSEEDAEDAELYDDDDESARSHTCSKNVAPSTSGEIRNRSGFGQESFEDDLLYPKAELKEERYDEEEMLTMEIHRCEVDKPDVPTCIHPHACDENDDDAATVVIGDTEGVQREDEDETMSCLFMSSSARVRQDVLQRGHTSLD